MERGKEVFGLDVLRGWMVLVLLVDVNGEENGALRTCRECHRLPWGFPE